MSQVFYFKTLMCFSGLTALSAPARSTQAGAGTRGAHSKNGGGGPLLRLRRVGPDRREDLSVAPAPKYELAGDAVTFRNRHHEGHGVVMRQNLWQFTSFAVWSSHTTLPYYATRARFLPGPVLRAPIPVSDSYRSNVQPSAMTAPRRTGGQRDSPRRGISGGAAGGWRESGCPSAREYTYRNLRVEVNIDPAENDETRFFSPPGTE
jgi:hypothetical protein